MTWREFIRTHRQSLLAVDFVTVDTIWLQRLSVLFFIKGVAAACISPVVHRIRPGYG